MTMSMFAQARGLTLPDPVSTGPTFRVLDAIAAPEVHLAMWERLRPTSLDWIEDLAFDEIDDINCGFDISSLAAEIRSVLIEAGYPSDGRAHALGAEIAQLATIFACVMSCDRLSVRLEVVETDACRKFHADVVAARLLSTLTGPATQWIRVHRPDDIHEMDMGEVAIFKGRLLAEEPLILHRSPPISGSGAKRLVLVINPDMRAS